MFSVLTGHLASCFLEGECPWTLSVGSRQIPVGRDECDCFLLTAAMLRRLVPLLPRRMAACHGVQQQRCLSNGAVRVTAQFEIQRRPASSTAAGGIEDGTEDLKREAVLDEGLLLPQWSKPKFARTDLKVRLASSPLRLDALLALIIQR